MFKPFYLLVLMYKIKLREKRNKKKKELNSMCEPHVDVILPILISFCSCFIYDRYKKTVLFDSTDYLKSHEFIIFPSKY